MNRLVLANIFVAGGSEIDRVEAVRVLHERSRLRDSPFHALHGGREHASLQRALENWLDHEDGPSPIDCAGGTLFVDDPGALPPLVQRLMLAYAGRLEGKSPADLDGRGPARLAAGGPDDLAADVASGRLMAELHDTLDKLRVELKGAGVDELH